MSTTESRTAAVLGGSGFVGSAVVQALEHRGWSVRVVPAPRLSIPARYVDAECLPVAFETETNALALEVSGVDTIVNAAGDPNASSNNFEFLLGPNGALPVVALRAAQRAQIARFLHVSSSVVQGDRDKLDSSSNWQAFSPYSSSKVAGERWLLAEPQSSTHVTIYRPPSVHSRGRAVTRKISALASSPLSSVAGRGDRPSPQALLENVGDAVAFLATVSTRPPTIVHHPWEGLTTRELLRQLGRREPRHTPMPLAQGLLRALRASEQVFPSLAPNRRRVELLWMGQGVEGSWLEDAGWVPPLGLDAWDQLAHSE
jgi:nucleoside-diphosphate-sugar epimerase